MLVSSKIAILQNIKKAVINKMMPITETLLSYIETFDVDLYGYRDKKKFAGVDGHFLNELRYSQNSLSENFIYSLVSNLKRYVYHDTNHFHGLNEKIVSNGLYHFTSSVDAILTSQTIHPSNFISSYGRPKTFFFDGIPTVGAFVTNLDVLPLRATAIRINPSIEMLMDSKFKVRNLDDGAISYDGIFSLDGIPFSKEYFCLMKEGDALVYKCVSKDFYDTYMQTTLGKALLKYLHDKKNVQAIQSDYLCALFHHNSFSYENVQNDKIR